MPQIIPIKALKNTSEISELCHKSKEPVFVTKNGYGDMVVMSMETYERMMYVNKILEKLAVSEKQIEEGKTKDAFKALEELRGKYGL